jgi:hypothetical protein
MFQGASPCHADELMYLGPEESFTFAPPTTTCCLSRLPAASHDYLLPPKTTCRLPRLPAAPKVVSAGVKRRF